MICIQELQDIFATGQESDFPQNYLKFFKNWEDKYVLNLQTYFDNL